MITILIYRARSGIAVTAALGVLTIAGCGDRDDLGPGNLDLVATTSVWADVAAEVAGDHADVVTLIPRGADAHDYQPSPRQVAALFEADVVIANGLGLEEGVADVLLTASEEGVDVLELAPALRPIPFPEHGHDGSEGGAGGENDDDGLDPHVWFDPLRVAEAARLIAGRLTEVEPGIDWMGRAEAYIAELETLDAEISAMLSAVPPERRALVTNHESLGYFAERYGFEVVGVVVPGGSTLAEPSSAELAALVEEILEQDVPAIFAETTSPARLADAVAAEAGDIAVVDLATESLGEPGSETGTLIGMLRANAEKIATALSTQG